MGQRSSGPGGGRVTDACSTRVGPQADLRTRPVHLARPPTARRYGNGFHGLDLLEPAWHTMLGGDWGGSYRQRPEYYRTYLEHLDSTGGSLQFIAVDDGQGLSLILPLEPHVLRRGPLLLRILQAPSHPHLKQFEAAYPTKRETAPALRILLSEAQAWRGWDALRFSGIGRESALAALAEQDPGRTVLRPRAAHAWFRCGAEADCIGRYSPHFRRNLARLRRRAGRTGALRLEIVTEPADLRRAYARFVALEASGWKGEAGTAIGASPRLLQFYASLVERFGALGRCQINLLKLGRSYIAGQLCLRDADRLAVLKIGYDEPARELAPGALLLDEVLRSAVADPAVERVDLTTAPQWAERWPIKREPLYDLWLFPRDVRGRALQALARLAGAARKFTSG